MFSCLDFWWLIYSKIHFQVASGVIPDTVIENDVPAEIDNDEAFNRYAEPCVAFMVINAADDFEPDIVSHYNDIMKTYQSFTDEFLEPFNQMRNYEFSEGGPGNSHFMWNYFWISSSNFQPKPSSNNHLT